jgi:hypothetical protein
MKGQISSVVRRLMEKVPTMSSRSRPDGRGACPERSEGICFGLSSSVGRRLGVALILCGLVAIVPYLAVTQEQNEIEETLQQSPLIGVTSSTQNPLQIALLHWYNANRTASFAVGSEPSGVAFDGANIWVANQNSNNVTKLRASDGKLLGTFAVGRVPSAWLLTGPTSGWRIGAASP